MMGQLLQNGATYRTSELAVLRSMHGTVAVMMKEIRFGSKEVHTTSNLHHIQDSNSTARYLHQIFLPLLGEAHISVYMFYTEWRVLRQSAFPGLKIGQTGCALCSMGCIIFTRIKWRPL